MVPFSESHPELAAQWHPTRNGELTAAQVSAGSNKKVWWQCPTDPRHEWDARCPDRVKASRCPFCTNKRLLVGYNDLATTHPHVAAQWHPSRNGDLSPDKVGAGATIKAWWQCPLHELHVWDGSIKDRARGGGGCPVCSGQLVIAGVNDLATVRPDLAAQWHPTKNGDLEPTQVVAGGARLIWWQCPVAPGHEWPAKGQDRVTGGQGCPFCSNKQVLAGYNDMATTHPLLAAEWHPTRNAPLDSRHVVAGTQKTLWWLCSLGHEFQSTGARRVAGEGCGVCANKKVLVGFNDMATTHPDLAAEFDLEANAPLTPQDVVAGTGRRLAWRCLVNPAHTWRVKASDRLTYNSGCPDCWYEAETSAGEGELAELVAACVGEGAVLRNHYLAHGKKRRNYDIVVPSLNVAIEFNGVYYHSESCGRGPDYHAEKHAVAAGAGYQLITVWQDDWEGRRAVVTEMIMHKLQASTLPRVAARQTLIQSVAPATAAAFLEAHHIQGSATGSIRIGLMDPARAAEDSLVALLVARVSGDTAEIVRYATGAIVPGGFTRLLAELERRLADRNRRATVRVSKIKTFADHTVSDGGLYESTGFANTGTIPPDYCYLVGSKRVHKFNYRVSRFRDDPTLQYVAGETETQLAARNNLPRIWDAGKTRWEKDLPAT